MKAALVALSALLISEPTFACSRGGMSAGALMTKLSSDFDATVWIVEAQVTGEVRYSAEEAKALVETNPDWVIFALSPSFYRDKPDFIYDWRMDLTAAYGTVFTVERTLKGDAPEKVVVVLLGTDEDPQVPVKPNVYWGRDGGDYGSYWNGSHCEIVPNFVEGDRHILFRRPPEESYDGKMYPAGADFRDLEPITRANDTWVRAVRLLSELQADVDRTD